MTIQANPPAGSEVERTDLVTVTIDDIEVKVPKNTLLIRAAEQIGLHIGATEVRMVVADGLRRVEPIQVNELATARGIDEMRAVTFLGVKNQLEAVHEDVLFQRGKNLVRRDA